MQGDPSTELIARMLHTDRRQEISPHNLKGPAVCVLQAVSRWLPKAISLELLQQHCKVQTHALNHKYNFTKKKKNAEVLTRGDEVMWPLHYYRQSYWGSLAAVVWLSTRSVILKGAKVHCDHLSNPAWLVYRWQLVTEGSRVEMHFSWSDSSDLVCCRTSRSIN